MEKTTSPELPLAEMKEIVKSFPGTLAVDKVDFVCNKGEIKGLVGENGAGKSTLVNCSCRDWWNLPGRWQRRICWYHCRCYNPCTS